MPLDFRVEWVKNKVTKCFGLDSEKYFEEMMNETDDLEDKLASYLDDDFVEQNENRQFFYVYKTSYEKLIEEEIIVAEKVKKPVVEVEPPPAVETTKKKKGGKEKKEKKGKKGKKDVVEVAPSEGEPPSDAMEPPSNAESPSEIVDGTTVEPPMEGATTESPVTETLPDADITDHEATDADVTDIEASPEEDTGGKKKKKKEKGKKKGKQKEKIPVVEETVVVEEEDEIIYVPQIIQKLVTDFTLHGGFMGIREEIGEIHYRYLFMYRKTEEGIPNFELPDTADYKMPTYFLIGITTGNFLNTLTYLSNQLFLPLLRASFIEPTAKRGVNDKKDKVNETPFKRPSDYRRLSMHAEKTAIPMFEDGSIITREHSTDSSVESATPIKDELVSDTMGLVTSLEWVCEHVDDELDLPMADISDILHSDVSDDELIKNAEIVTTLENLVVGWETHIIKVMESFLSKTPQGHGPLPEYDYWHEREAALSSIVEQLKKPLMTRLVNMLEKVKPQTVNSFIRNQVDLKRHYHEARDNVKFLSTIRRQLRVITYSMDFWKVKECIPLLIEGLHLIWVLSRYYNTDEVMVPFMERIVWCLLEKGKRALNNEVLFRKPLSEVKRLTSEAKEMLEVWKTSYMETRKKIEESGKGQRWEFDKRKLFAASGYMALVCQDLHDVAMIIYHFKNIFGPELRAIVSDPQSIDNVAKRVDRLVVQIENTDFDIFDQNSKENWEAIMESFHKEVRKLELEGVNFVDQSFKMIRSSERALEMLIKFKHIETRQIILQRLMIKFDVILDQYTKEILTVDDNFTRYKRHPVLNKNMPPHGGAIYWVRLLFYKLKLPILKFQKVPELMDSPTRNEAFLKYLAIAKELKAYEKSKLDDWLNIYGPAMERAMQMDVLKLVNSPKRAATFFRPIKPGQTAVKQIPSSVKSSKNIRKRMSSFFYSKPVRSNHYGTNTVPKESDMA